MVFPWDSWHVKSPSVYATPLVHAVGTGLSNTACWYAARLPTGMSRRIVPRPTGAHVRVHLQDFEHGAERH